MTEVYFHLNGTPVGKGSMKFVGMRGGKPILVPTGGYPLVKWTEAIKRAAKEAVTQGVSTKIPVSGDVEIRVRFGLDNRRQNDVDKLCRELLDSLTGIFYLDDRQVTHLEASKHFDGKGFGGADVWVKFS